MRRCVTWLLALSIAVSSSCAPARSRVPATTVAVAATTPAPAATRAPAPTATWTAAPSAAPSTPAASPSQLLSPPDASHEGVFEAVWQQVRDHYVYTDFNGLDWDAVHVDYGAQVRAATSDAEFYALLKEMITALNDNHSRFLSPDEAREEDRVKTGSASFVGVGFWSAKVPEKGTLTILIVWPGSPAEAAGLRPHDSILAINGQSPIPAPGQPAPEIRGAEGTPVTFTVRSVGGQPRDVVMLRARLSRQLPIVAKRLPGDIGYLMISAYDDETIVKRMVEEMYKLGAVGKPLKGMILDVRQNYGGLLKVARECWSLFLDGTVLYVLDHGKRIRVSVTGRDVRGSQSLPLVVLAGPHSESTGEVTAGILWDLGRARVVGMPTAGNVELMERHNYPDGSRLWLAQQTLRPPRHGNVQWEGQGVIPDVLVEAAWDEFTEENDPQLQAALELLTR